MVSSIFIVTPSSLSVHGGGDAAAAREDAAA
jgi:hypothetical protein